MIINDKIGKYLTAGRSWYTRDVKTITKFSIHHDAIPHSDKTAEQVMQQIMNGHVAQGWPGASYHFYIHKDGTIYQMNKLEWVTWIDGVNWDAIGIVLNGYFHPNYNNKPTQAQLEALKWLLDELSTKHPEFPASQGDVLGHRERAATSCPGDLFFPYVKEYREKLGQVSWGTTPAPTPTPTPTPTPVITEDTLIPQIENKSVRDIKNELLLGREEIKKQTTRAETAEAKIVNAIDDLTI